MIRSVFAPLRQHFRGQRYLFIRNLTQVESLQGFILDLGGGAASFFATVFPRPGQVVLVDIDYKKAYQAKNRQPALNVVVADGARLPFANGSLEMTICNSVIEHVNNPDELAAEVNRISQGYFLQTPNGNFPVETHSYIAIPFYNFIPWAWLRRLVCRLFGANFDYVSSVCYLSEQKLKNLFPQSTIDYERTFGLKKSFYVFYLNRCLQ